MSISLLTPPPAQPIYTGDAAAFNSAMIAHQFGWAAGTNYTEMNENVIPGINQLIPAINGAIAGQNYKGDWNSSTAYVQGDSVSHDDYMWLAKVGNTNVEPVDGATWQIVPINPQPEAFASFQVFTASGTYTRSDRVVKTLVIAGAGGAGGGISAPGTSGTVAIGFVSPGVSETVTIGAGGAGSIGSSLPGTNSSFGSLMSSSGTGAALTLPSFPILNIGTRLQGGASPLGLGWGGTGAVSGSGLTGGNATGFVAGGGNGDNSTTAGGNGGNGIVIVAEFR